MKLKKFVSLSMLSLLIGSTNIAHAIGPKCQIQGWGAIPSGTLFSLGANLSAIVNAAPAVATAIANGAAPWNQPGVHSAGRIAGATGIVYPTDCPENNNYKIGAWAFLNGTTGTPLCSSEPRGGSGIVLAYTLGSTRSIGFNTNVVWSTDPLPGQYDLQSTATHELGHVLSLDHEANGVCGVTGSTPCTANLNGKETMSWGGSGETCRRTLSPNDIDSVNQIYP